jgi:H+/gluconate symporter-like permease
MSFFDHIDTRRLVGIIIAAIISSILIYFVNKWAAKRRQKLEKKKEAEAREKAAAQESLRAHSSSPV